MSSVNPKQGVFARLALAGTLVLAISGATLAQSASLPLFSKNFSPSSIGPDSISTLTFTIDNQGSAAPADDLAFTDTLPAGVTIATPAQAMTDCVGGTLDAPEGGTVITLSGSRVGAGASCQVTVNVTSSTPGTHMNVSGDLTSTAGNSGPASADLTVDSNLPGFSKIFSPATVVVNHVSTLTFTIDDSQIGSLVSSLNFTDDLPAGLVIASPANATNSCNSSLTANPGASTISSFGGFTLANSTCTISVDVLPTVAGTFDNVTSPLTSSQGTAGKAGAVLQAERDVLVKAFTDDPAPPGGTATLQFTITNFDRVNSLTNLAFTDDLDATLSGLVATGLPANDVCGPGSSLSGTSLLSLTGGNLGPGESCTFSVTAQVPGGAVPGNYSNTTSTLSGDLGGSPTTFNPATDTLSVDPEPILTKSFIDDPLAAGGTVTLEFTIANSDASAAATGISFTDNFSAMLSGTTINTLPASGACGAGSTFSQFSPGPGEIGLLVSNASLAAGGTCTFDVTLNIPLNVPTGSYGNTTSPVTATVNAQSVTGDPASDALQVVGAPTLIKAFTNDPVQAGDTVTLQFTVDNSAAAEGGADATGISFTDDLGAALGGLTAVGLPQNDVCGAGSQISGTSTLSFTGGDLAAGASCTFQVTLQVPAAASSGIYTNTTSSLAATVSGLAVTGQPASDDLQVGGIIASKSFTDDPAYPDGAVTLEFSLQNNSLTDNATGISFTDNLGTVLSGLTPTGLPLNDVCGSGSTLSQSGSTLILSGGSINAAGSCTFQVTLQVPPGAQAGIYGNTTSQIAATLGMTTGSFPPAQDSLTILDPMEASKTFTGDPVLPGGTVTLSFTITNNHPSDALSSITFSDDLDAVLAGLVATGLPANDVCGAGSTLSGTSTLTLTGGNLAPLSSCTFAVTLQVPASATAGTYLNTASAVNAGLGDGSTSAPPPSDSLQVTGAAFGKSFAGPAGPGGTVQLSFTIQNLSTTGALSDVAFADDLDAVLPGLAAVGLPATDVCGTGSSITGTSVLALSGASLPAGGSCTINVTVQVPPAAATGTYTNTTGPLTSGGIQLAVPASADLTVEPPPAFAKSFTPAGIGVGGTSTLTFTIDNTLATAAATNLAFTDNLPAGLLVAATPNASTTCAGGTLSAVSSGSSVVYSGGSVPAGSTCMVQADVTAPAPGTFVNTSGALTSSLGDSGTATATLVAGNPPGFTKAFGESRAPEGSPVTLVFTIDNSASSLPADNLSFTDNLPSGMHVAGTPNAGTTCGGGTLSAVAGASSISYSGGSVAAGSTCTVQVDVVADRFGNYTNTAGPLDSSLGNSATATATLQVSRVGPIPTLGWRMLVLLLALMSVIAALKLSTARQ